MRGYVSQTFLYFLLYISTIVDKTDEGKKNDVDSLFSFRRNQINRDRTFALLLFPFPVLAFLEWDVLNFEAYGK